MNRRDLFKALAAIPVVTLIPDITSGSDLATVDINDAKWHHISYRNDLGRMRYWVDGCEVSGLSTDEFMALLYAGPECQGYTYSFWYKKDVDSQMPVEGCTIDALGLNVRIAPWI